MGRHGQKCIETERKRYKIGLRKRIGKEREMKNQ